MPFQIFDSTLKIGVVAFHDSGADVRFSVNSSEVETVTAPTYNDRTDVYEYWTELNAANYSDGPITVSAVALPDDSSHYSRTLDDITLYANSGGSLTSTSIAWADSAGGNDDTGDGSEGNPYQTLGKAYEAVDEGGTVYLKAGDYNLRDNIVNKTNSTYWTKITSDPATTKDQVIITSNNARDSDDPNKIGPLRNNLIHFSNVTLKRELRGITTGDDERFNAIVGFSYVDYAWFDSVVLEGGDYSELGSTYNVQNAMIYTTDSTIQNITDAFSNSNFGRNVYIDTLDADGARAISNQIFINIEIVNWDPLPGSHADLIQFYLTAEDNIENIIMYNVKALDIDAQMIKGPGAGLAKDIAFVNWLVEHKTVTAPDTLHQAQLGFMQNVLFWHFTTERVELNIRTPSSVSHFNIQNNIFFTLFSTDDNDVALTELDSSTIQYNHCLNLNWRQTRPMGTNHSNGEVNYDANYIPQTNIQTGTALECVPADIDNNPFNSVPSLGAVEYR